MPTRVLVALLAAAALACATTPSDGDAGPTDTPDAGSTPTTGDRVIATGTFLKPLLVTETHVHVVRLETDLQAGTQRAFIARVANAGGAVEDLTELDPTLLRWQPQGFGTDGTSLFFLAEDPATHAMALQKLPLGGGTPVVLKTWTYGYRMGGRILVRNGFVYAHAELGDVFRIPVGGGTAERVVQARDFDADDTHLYYSDPRTNETNVYRKPLAGGDAELVAALPHVDADGKRSDNAHELAVDGDRIVMRRYGSSAGTSIVSLPKAGGAVTVVSTASIALLEEFRAVDAHDGWIYRTNFNSYPATLARLPIDGGAEESFVADETGTVRVEWFDVGTGGLAYLRTTDGEGTTLHLVGL